MKYLNRNEGITLIEIIITIAILGIITAGFLPMFTGSVVGIYTFGERYQYFSEAQGVLEEQLAKQYDEILTGTTTNNIDDEVQIIITVTERSSHNANTLDINVSGINTGNLQIYGKEIEVKAVYIDGGKVLVSLTSFIPDPYQ